MSARSKPHGEQNASTSSIQPSAEPPQRLGEVLREQPRGCPASETIRWSAAGISGLSAVTWLAGLALICAAACTRRAVSTSGSDAAAV